MYPATRDRIGACTTTLEPGRYAEPRIADRLLLGLASLLTGSALVTGLALYGGILPADRHRVTVVALAATALWAIWLALGRRGRTASHIDLSALAWPFGLAGLALVSTLWSVDRSASLWEGAILLGSLSAFLAGSCLTGNGRGGRPDGGPDPTLRVLSTLGMVLAAGSLVGYLLQSERWVQVQDHMTLLSGPFGYANAMAGLLLMTIPASLGWLTMLGATGSRRRVSTVQRMVLWLGLAVQLSTLVLTASRAAMAILMGLLVVGQVLLPPGRPVRKTMSRMRTTRAFAVLLAVVAVLVTAAAGLVLWRVASYVAGLWAALYDKTATADQNRLQTWYAAAQAAGQRPILGHGAGTFYSAYMPFRIPWSAPARYAHDLLVQQWVELGAVGVGVMVGTFVTLLARPAARRRVTSGTEPGIWLLCGMAGVVLQNLVDVTWYFPVIYFLFLFAAGSLAAWSTLGTFKSR